MEIIIAIVALAIGAAAGYFYSRNMSDRTLKAAEMQAHEIIVEAEGKSKEAKLQAKEETLQLRNEVEKELGRKRHELDRQEERLQKRQETLDQRIENVDRRERTLSKRQSQIDKRTHELEQLNQERVAELERVAAMTRDEAKAELVQAVEIEAHQDMARVLRQVEADIKEQADRTAREIVTLAIQRIATDEVSETTVSAVPLPSDDMKGRIIGRQGRNIRAFENATGVDVVVDDTPEAIILTGFDRCAAK